MKPRALIVGAGSMGRRRAQAARDRGYEVDAYDVNPVRAPKVGEAVTWEHVANVRTPYDVAFVCTPPETHVKIARELVRFGTSAIFIEKPLSTNLDLTETLVDEAARAGTFTIMGQTLRWHRDLRKMRDLVEDGALGTIINVRAEFGHRLTDWAHPDPTSTYRNGVLVDAATHEIDLALWLADATAHAVTAVAIRTGVNEMEAEDLVDMTLLLDSGATVNVHADLVDTEYRRRIVVMGLRITSEWTWRYDSGMYDRETSAFLDAAERRAKGDANAGSGLPDFARGRRILLLALAARQSEGRLLQV